MTISIFSEEAKKMPLEKLLARMSLSEKYAALVSSNILHLDVPGFGDLRAVPQANLELIYESIIFEETEYRRQVEYLHETLVGIRRSRKYSSNPFKDAQINSDIRNNLQRNTFLFDQQYVSTEFIKKLQRRLKGNQAKEAREAYEKLHAFQQHVQGGKPYNTEPLTRNRFDMQAFIYPDAFSWTLDANEFEPCPYIAASSIRFKQPEDAVFKAARSQIKHAELNHPGLNPWHLAPAQKIDIFQKALVRDIGGVCILFVGESDKITSAIVNQLFGVLQHDDRIHPYYDIDRENIRNHYENPSSVLNEVRVPLIPTARLPENLATANIGSSRTPIDLWVTDYRNHVTVEFGPRSHAVLEAERLRAERGAKGEKIDYKEKQAKFIEYLTKGFSFP